VTAGLDYSGSQTECGVKVEYVIMSGKSVVRLEGPCYCMVHFFSIFSLSLKNQFPYRLRETNKLAFLLTMRNAFEEYSVIVLR